MNEIKKEFKLKPFDGNGSNLILTSEVTVKNSNLIILFNLKGDLSKVTLPAKKTKASRVVGLWNSTCFEFFIRTQSKQEYLEFNFSPSHDWNCFRFLTNNQELKEWNQLNTITVESKVQKDEFIIFASIDRNSLPATFSENSNLFISTTAVINFEDVNGYWAIKHTDNRPNFHHPESYVKLINTSDT